LEGKPLLEIGVQILGNHWKSLEISGNHWSSLEISENQQSGEHFFYSGLPLQYYGQAI